MCHNIETCARCGGKHSIDPASRSLGAVILMGRTRLLRRYSFRDQLLGWQLAFRYRGFSEEPPIHILAAAIRIFDLQATGLGDV